LTEVSLYIIQVIYTERHIRITINDTLSYIEHLTSSHVSHFGFDYVPQEQFRSETLGDEMKEKKDYAFYVDFFKNSKVFCQASTVSFGA
jgi:uncharacterized radical SAM superfamily Fe-S cluster-containing enzyme